MTTWHESTRLHDDAIRVAQQVNESQAPLKYVTYAPGYLIQESCHIGTRGNCTAYAPMDVAAESRLGKLTDLRAINRNDTQLYPKRQEIDNPDKSTGGLLSDDQVNAYARLFAPQQFSKPCDVNATGNFVTNHFDRGNSHPTAQNDLPVRLFDRSEVMRSSRVERRNQWTSKSC